MRNIFIQAIRQGRIHSQDELKSVYRRMVRQTHPDAVGSERLVEQYLECRRQYEEARAAFAEDRQGHEPPASSRLRFYQEFYRLERMDKPWAFNRHFSSRAQIDLTRKRAFEYFCRWQPEHMELYEQAHRIYDQIKLEKPRGPYRKHALLYNLSPVFHNILSYQLSGLPFYRKQLRQNFAAVMFQLEQRQFHKLAGFIQLLIADIAKGPAIHEPD